MHSGTIYFNGLDLSGLGKPRMTISQQADPPAPAFPTRQITTLKVTVDLAALDPGTIQARARHLQQSMQVADGILRCSQGSGHGVEWLAVPTGNNLSAVLDGSANAVEISFTAVENHSTGAVGAITGATFTPAGSSLPIQLHALRDMKEDISPERHSVRASARKLTTHTISFTARVAQANPADPLANRLAWLQAYAAQMNALDCRDGTLVFGSVNRIVRITEFTPAIDENRGVLDVRVQCFYTVMPDSNQAEADFEIKTRTEAGSGEKVLSYAGTIEAETRTIALAKLDSIRQNLSTGNRRTVSYETTDKVIDGADTFGIAGGDWTGSLSFSLELREPRAGSHYNLKISTARDTRGGMRWTYSGSVTAASSATALTIARSLVAATGHPIRTKSEETLEYVSAVWIEGTGAQPSAVFVKLDFSYEFEGPSDGFVGGEISTDRNLPLFGEYRRVVSGFLVASSKAMAETILITLLTGESTAIEKTLKWSEVYLNESGNGTRVFQKLEFTAGSREMRGSASVKYTDTTQNDGSSMISQRDVSGSIWTNSEENAKSVLNELLNALFGVSTNHPQRISTTHHKERWGNSTSSAAGFNAWAQMDFQLGKTSKLVGEVGHDIIEAGYSVERVGALNATVITHIPFGRPVAQINTGHMAGKVTINAHCKSVLCTTAVAWVQRKRDLVTALGGYETEQPRELLTPEHAPFSGSDVTTWNFTGTYSWTFIGTQLDGLWQEGFAGIGDS